ncbi:MAG TPA: hypothetical protein VGR11_14795 [Solirubrobacteraceae bacterium]|nr:hypothetical protein [Solirubrobacteraceae bacterium]
MYDLMISLLAPGEPHEIDQWVEEQVERLRHAGHPHDLLLGRLVRARPHQGGHWLIKVDRRARAGPPEKDVVLAAVVIDLERLGLRPALFASTGRARALAEPRRSSHKPARVTTRCGPRARRSPPI